MLQEHLPVWQWHAFTVSASNLITDARLTAIIAQGGIMVAA